MGERLAGGTVTRLSLAVRGWAGWRIGRSRDHWHGACSGVTDAQVLAPGRLN